MTLPAASQVSFSAIQTEHGGSGPISLSEYYAGGPYVYSGTTGNNGAIPSSGEISVDDLRNSSTAQTLDTRFSNATNGYYAGEEVTPVNVANATALDGAYADWGWYEQLLSGSGILFYNPVTLLSATATIVNLEFEVKWSTSNSENNKNIRPKIQNSASTRVSPVSTTPDTRFINNKSGSPWTESISGSPADWGVSNAQLRAACRNTSSSSTANPAWVVEANMAGTGGTSATRLDSVRLIITYVT